MKYATVIKKHKKKEKATVPIMLPFIILVWFWNKFETVIIITLVCLAEHHLKLFPPKLLWLFSSKKKKNEEKIKRDESFFWGK
jgi:hypothetical protein